MVANLCLAGILEEAEYPESLTEQKSRLDPFSRLKHELLCSASFRQGTVLFGSHIRLLLRNKACFRQNQCDKSHIANCLKDLVSCGLLRTNTKNGPDDKGRAARKVQKSTLKGSVNGYVKASLEDVQASEAAEKERIRVCVPVTCF
jgi:hypothetical protein